MQINLTDIDFERCVDFAHKHIEQCVKINARLKYDQPSKLTFEHALQGYLGEQAVAHYFNYDFVFKSYNKLQYDILGYEVRTVYYSNAILITHSEDKLGNYILVSVDKNKMVATLKGWSPLYRCNLWQSNWQSDWRYPCFGMPEAQLWPIDTLPATAELLQHQNRLTS